MNSEIHLLWDGDAQVGRLHIRKKNSIHRFFSRRASGKMAKRRQAFGLFGCCLLIYAVLFQTGTIQAMVRGTPRIRYRDSTVAVVALHARQIKQIDNRWTIDLLPDFHAWKPIPKITGAMISRLHCPWPAGLWKPVQLPNDYIVAGKVVKSGRLMASHGFLPLYPAWYRRTFSIPASAKGKTIWMNFGGVYRDAVVFINGELVGQHPGGYTAFRYNIGRFVRYGRSNTLAVFVDPRFFEVWWYEGGGIYRHVRLIITDKLHVAPWGTFVISKVPGEIHYGSPQGDYASAELTIRTTVDNAHKAGRRFTLISRIIGPDGKVLQSIANSETLAAGAHKTFIQHAGLRDAALWSLHHCHLYHLETGLDVGGTVVDDKRTTFGIRTLRFDPNRGFFLDGKHVEIKGTANHQDFPAVGIGAPNDLWYWRIDKLKAMGSNAYRTAHNPLASAFYRACDHLGMLVMDENRHLGDVYTSKTAPGSPYHKLTDLKAMILQDRNYPCVIMWSLCNEELYTEATAYGVRVFKAMMRAVHQIDPTRPCTCAYCVYKPTHAYFGNGFMKVENILGCNYSTNLFAQLHKEIPDKMIFGSEDINMFSDRGVVRTNFRAGHINEYGTAAHMWVKSGGPGLVGDRAPWLTLIPVMQHPFVAGAFVWTGFDYLGEPNPIGWPDVSSQVGSMDRCGFPKPCYYYWRAWWNRKRPSVYVFPAWTFPKSMIGKPVLVRCYSNCRRVALFLNGKNLGVKRMNKYKYLDWNVNYAPGLLTALGYDGPRVAARWSCRTAGRAAALRLRDEVPPLAANGENIAPIAVKVVDRLGHMAPYADNVVQFSVAGAGSIAGVCNGDPACHDSNVGHTIPAFNGLCMVLVRVADHPGKIIITACARGLPAATLTIRTLATRAAKNNRWPRLFRGPLLPRAASTAK